MVVNCPLVPTPRVSTTCPRPRSGTPRRGAGWAAAGLQKNHAACIGPVAALITRGTGDGGTPLDQAEQARASFIMRNGCTTQTQPWLPGETTFDSSSCVAYQGCMTGYPVVWCPTPGGYSNGLASKLTSFRLWKLWSSLPSALTRRL